MALHVRHVRGRYPHRGVLRSDNIVATITEIGRIYRIRLDDERFPDAWLELVVEDDLHEPRPDANGELTFAG